jgi:hypothetical protein
MPPSPSPSAKAAGHSRDRSYSLQATGVAIASIPFAEYHHIHPSSLSYPDNDSIAIVTLSGIGQGCTFTLYINRRTGDPFHGSTREPAPAGEATPTPTPTTMPFTKDNVALGRAEWDTNSAGDRIIKGSLRNNTGEEWTAEVEFNLYDASGILIGTALGKTYLQPRARPGFSAPITDDRAATFTLRAIRGNPAPFPCKTP